MQTFKNRLAQVAGGAAAGLVSGAAFTVAQASATAIDILFEIVTPAKERIRSRPHGGPSVRRPGDRRARRYRRREAPRQSPLRLSRTRAVGAVVLLCAIGLIMGATAPRASAEWVSLPGGTAGSGQWFEDTSTGDVEQFTNKGLVNSWSAQQFSENQDVVNALGHGFSDPGVSSQLEQDIINSTPNINYWQAQDAADVLEAARSAGTSLDPSVLSGLEQAGQDVQVWKWGPGADPAVWAPTGAAVLGWVIGEGIDELFGWPSLEVFLKKQVQAAVVAQCRWCSVGKQNVFRRHLAKKLRRRRAARAATT